MYWLLFIVLSMFFATYTIFRDLFHPAMIICESYFLGILCACYNINSWGDKLEVLTIKIITIGIISFIVGSILAMSVPTVRLKNVKYNNKIKKEVKLESININRACSWSLVIISITLLSIYMICWLKAIGGFHGIQAISSQMTQYRYELSYENNVENNIPGIVNQLTKVLKAIAYTYMYIHLYNKKICKLKNERYNLEIQFILCSVCYIVITLMTGGRFEMFVYFIAYIVMESMLNRLSSKRKSISLKSMFKIVNSIVIMVVIFSISRKWVGRTDDSKLLVHFTKYFGGGIKLLDEYIKNPIAKSDIWGKETFYAINKFMYQLGILKQTYNRHLEFRMVNGSTLGNIYTSMRAMYQDFGIMGVIILQFLLGIFFTRWYKSLKIKVGKSIDVELIFYCIIIHVIYLSMYLEFFYSTVLSINYVIFFICLITVAKVIEKIGIEK